MELTRRNFLRRVSAGAGATYLTSRGAESLAASAEHADLIDQPVNAYKYRIAYGCWINDMRQEPLPLEQWPAPLVDDMAVGSVLKAMDVQSPAGFNMLDVWGLFATYDWPPDIASVVDAERRRRINEVLKAANDRGIKVILGFGNYSWGYGKITEADPSVRGRDRTGKPLGNVLCDANPKSFEYVKRMLDFALSEFDFAGVHLESCDLGCCECPECAGKYGTVGYNVRINRKTADYIRSRWPDKTVYVITIGWLRGASGGTGRAHFSAEEKTQIVQLSKHINCIFDQGHHGYHVAEDERRDFIRELHCDFGTSGHLWLYPDARWDRASYFLPYPRRTGKAIQSQYDQGVRGCLFYQGPVNNAGTEVTIAVGGRMLADTSRDPDDVLGEVIELYYQPKSEETRKKLVEIFQRAEDSYFGDKSGERFLAPLLDVSPGPATFLTDPNLGTAGRTAYKSTLVSILQDLPKIEGNCHDQGRLKNIKRSVIATLNLLNTVSSCLGERN